MMSAAWGSAAGRTTSLGRFENNLYVAVEKKTWVLFSALQLQPFSLQSLRHVDPLTFINTLFDVCI
jgi:hypothetical protein